MPAWLVGLIVTGALLSIALLARLCVFVVAVHGPSMEPTYRDGDRLLAVRRVLGKPSRGRVAVFRSPLSGGERLIIKRIAAVAGDPAPAWRPVSPHALWHTDTVDSGRIPPGHVLVLGDSGIGTDSRVFGYVPEQVIHGYAVLRRPIAPSPTRSG